MPAYKKFIQYFFIALVCISIPGVVLWKNILPSFSYDLSKLDQFGSGLTLQNIGDGNEYFVVNPSMDYNYGKIIVEFSSSEKVDYQVSAMRGYFEDVYPLGEPIDDTDTLKSYLFWDNQTNVPNGTLGTYGDAVYFISRGKKLPISSPQVFERLGFHWELLVPLESSDLIQFETGNKIDFRNPHPDGTILKNEKGQCFLVWEQKRLPIAGEEIIFDVWKDFYWVNVTDDATKTQECNVNSGSDDEISCEFWGKSLEGKMGSSYIFKIKGNEPIKNESVNITLRTLLSYDKNVAKDSLVRIKTALASRYRDVLTK